MVHVMLINSNNLCYTIDFPKVLQFTNANDFINYIIMGFFRGSYL